MYAGFAAGCPSVRNGTLAVSNSTTALDTKSAIRTRNDVPQFAGCSALVHVSIPPNVVAIGAGAFEGCTGLRSVSWPLAHTSEAHIGPGAFANCTALTHFIFPSTLQTIGKDAFANARALIAVNFPANVRLVARGAFDDSIIVPATQSSVLIYAARWGR